MRPQQSVTQALAEAFGHRSYMLLVLGFFTCGFQIFFIAIHLPAYLVDRGLPVEIGGWSLAVIGLFNMASLGLRAFSGVSVGLIGSLIGIHWSLALSALATMAIAGGLLTLP